MYISALVLSLDNRHRQDNTNFCKDIQQNSSIRMVALHCSMAVPYLLQSDSTSLGSNSLYASIYLKLSTWKQPETLCTLYNNVYIIYIYHLCYIMFTAKHYVVYSNYYKYLYVCPCYHHNVNNVHKNYVNNGYKVNDFILK